MIYGIHPVREAVDNPERRMGRIFVAMGGRGKAIREAIEAARQKNIPVEFKERDYLDLLTGGRIHQGIVGLCSDFSYAKVEEIIDRGRTLCAGNLVLLLDGVQDPRNLGSLIRTAHCFGAGGVVIPENRAVSVTGTVIKASAGAAHHVPIARVVNLARTVDYLKEKGFWIYGAAPDGEPISNGLDYSMPIGLLMGSEGDGIRPLLREKCDFLVSIPMEGRIDSLNVSVAAGILMFEMLRKSRRVGK